MPPYIHWVLCRLLSHIKCYKSVTFKAYSPAIRTESETFQRFGSGDHIGLSSQGDKMNQKHIERWQREFEKANTGTVQKMPDFSLDAKGRYDVKYMRWFVNRYHKILG